MAGGKGKSHGGKAAGGKVSEGGKTQQSHSAKAGLQVSSLFLVSACFYEAFRRHERVESRAPILIRNAAHGQHKA